MRVLAVAVLIVALGCTPTSAPTTPTRAPTSPPTRSADAALPTPTATPPAGSPIAAVGEIVEARSEVPRNSIGTASDAQLSALVAADRDFAFNLYRTLVASEQDNVFISPYSISTAMSMVLAGARGQTAEELASALRIGADENVWHAARNRLELEMAAIANYDPPFGGDAVPLTLEPTNAIFGQAGYPFKPDFLDILAANYGAGMNAVDFRTQPEPSRIAINEWVAERTRDRIEELLPGDSISVLTRAVLVNAIYFKANWAREFDPEQTETEPFHLLDGSTVDVQMMHSNSDFTYADGDGWQAVQLSYWGGATMLIIVPDEGDFTSIERRLDAELLEMVDRELQGFTVDLRLPRWESSSKLELTPPLSSLGVELLFDDQNADLSGIADVEQLFVSRVLHDANITVDEEGTEAAAATAAVVDVSSGPPPPASLTVDRPFIYLIRAGIDREILFMGRLLQP